MFHFYDTARLQDLYGVKNARRFAMLEKRQRISL